MTSPNYMKQKLTEIKGEIDNFIILEGFKNLYSIMDRTTRQNTNKEVKELNIIKYLYLLDIHGTHHAPTAVYTLFSSAHGILPRIDHMVGHRQISTPFKGQK